MKDIVKIKIDNNIFYPYNFIANKYYQIEMNLHQIVINTCENFKEVTMFPFIKKSKENISIIYDIIPIKYNNKNYFISLAFPYIYDITYLQISSSKESKIIHSLNLIHSSDELNLSIFTCEDSVNIDTFYTLDDLKYKIPKDKFDDFKFLNNREEKLIDINHIDYIFENFDSPQLPPFAYLACQSNEIYNGSILLNLSNKSIYGIVSTKRSELNIVIPSIAIKRLLEGLSSNFEYSNFYGSYELYNSSLNNGILVCESKYDNIIQNEVILNIQGMDIINGNIKYNRIDEWVPIEVYLWYEWLPSTMLEINTYYMSGYAKKYLQFIDYKHILKIPISNQNEDSKIKKLTFRLMEYFIEKNIILDNEIINMALTNPYKSETLYLDINEELINLKCHELTYYPVNLVNL